MLKINISICCKLFFILWVILWINFLARDLTKKRNFETYKILLSRDEIGRKSYIYGDNLFEFLEFCKKNIPAGSEYDIIGLEEFSIDSRRAIYFLYPDIKKKYAEYLLIFNQIGYKPDPYEIYRKLDSARFILKRR